MRLTSATRYAVEALLYLGGPGKGGMAASHDIARARGTPERFLLKVLKPLVTAGVLHSVRGPNGGYRLARPLRDLTLLEMVEAVDGPIRGHAPADVCDDGGGRLNEALQAACDRAADGLRKELGKVRLADLAGAK